MGQSLCVEAWEAMTKSGQSDGMESIDFESPKGKTAPPPAFSGNEEATENDGNSSTNTPPAPRLAKDPPEKETKKEISGGQDTSEVAPLVSGNGNANGAPEASSESKPPTESTSDSVPKTNKLLSVDENTDETTAVNLTSEATKPIDPIAENTEEETVRETPSITPENSAENQDFMVPVRDETTRLVVDTAAMPSPSASIGIPSPYLRREQTTGTQSPLPDNSPRVSITLPGTTPSLSVSKASRKSDVGHHRSRSEGILTFEDATRLQASWSNADPEDFSPFSHAAKFGHHSSTFLDEPRRSSVSIKSGAEDGSVNPDGSGISSIIHDAARITNWGTVKELCETDPEAASYVGRDRWTALHHACNRRCPYPDVVEALINAYPDALVQEEDKGWLPLHYACRFKAPKDVVRLLIHQYPEKGRLAVTRLDRQDRTPLYYAVRYDAPPGVVGLLLEVDATAVLEEDQNADSPLALVWDAWAEKMEGKRTLQRIYVSSEEAETMSLEEQAAKVEKRLKSQKKLYGRWNQVDIFLKAAFGFKVDDEEDEVKDAADGDSAKGSKADPNNGRKWRILHATAAIKCHPSLFMLAKALHPEQVAEIDNKDLKGPVHISGDETAAHSLTPLHLAASSHANGEASRLVINELLRMNPSAAEAVDSSNSLPFHRIVENKYKPHWTSDGAKDLYMANTAALNATDSEGKMPLHRAAAAIIYGESSATATRARSAICNLLELSAEAAEHADNFGCLPLHLVAQHGSQWDSQVQSLYDANPAAARSRTGVKLLNRLPLHMAASNPLSEFSMIDTLVQMNPRGATQADRKGNYPLHLACAARLSWESINAIHKAYPEAVQEAEGNDRGWTALMIAASNADVHVDVISNLSDIYPQGAGVAGNDGRYAFHLACFAGRKWEEGLSALFQAYPDALGTPDSLGLLPFHIVAFRYSASPEEAIPAVPEPAAQNERGFSKSSSFDAERAKLEELEDAKRIENLFHLLKADPTVLSAY